MQIIFLIMSGDMEEGNLMRGEGKIQQHGD